MKDFVLFTIGLLLVASVYAGPPGTSQPPVWNPFGGHLQYLGPGNGLLSGDTYYFYNDSGSNAYYTFDGSNLCLFVNDVGQVCYPTMTVEFLSLEDGTFILLEDGTRIILE